jgi:ABC-type polysaccharide/polyol phosphate transport system ATPase subunit
MALTLTVDGLGKRYRLGATQASTTLAETLAGLRSRGRARAGEIWALRDVGLEVREGEVVGIVGPNGAGKSTLLKILARITEPTEGVARTRGRVGALLEVGTAFHPELTGRENIRINGALLGMSKRDVRRRFDEIVEFAGVGAFLDTPLKRYSSGMYLRLAFAVAAHYEPDIVVVDEVLAVGDAEFQQRCLGKMSEFGREGRTVLFVSHDLGAIGRLCRRALWLDHGAVREDGPASDVLERYLAAVAPVVASRSLPDSGDADAPAALRHVAIVGREGSEDHVRGEPLTVRLSVETRRRAPGLDAAVWILDGHGLRVLDESPFDVADLASGLDAPGRYEIRLALPGILPAGEYVMGVWLGSEAGVIRDGEVLRFRVLPSARDRAELGTRRRVLAPAGRWVVDRRSGS